VASQKSPWNITRHIPSSSELEELRRCFNLVWNEFYRVEAAADGVVNTLQSKISNQVSSSSSSFSGSASVPAWTKTIGPPFGIITLNPDGSVLTDSRGYGIIQKVL
jgi:hypothetical protein